jgi:hypothetical protein
VQCASLTPPLKTEKRERLSSFADCFAERCKSSPFRARLHSRYQRCLKIALPISSCRTSSRLLRSLPVSRSLVRHLGCDWQLIDSTILSDSTECIDSCSFHARREAPRLSPTASLSIPRQGSTGRLTSANPEIWLVCHPFAFCEPAAVASLKQGAHNSPSSKTRRLLIRDFYSVRSTLEMMLLYSGKLFLRPSHMHKVA